MFCEFYDFAILAFFLSGCIKPVSSCSDDEEPQRDATAAPSTQDIIADEPSMQETEPAVQALRATRASVKKVPVT
jgi:PBP1b-binding outer membrane lipoprotein LpoB